MPLLATAAGGTHPTIMYTCFFSCCRSRWDVSCGTKLQTDNSKRLSGISYQCKCTWYISRYYLIRIIFIYVIMNYLALTEGNVLVYNLYWSTVEWLRMCHGKLAYFPGVVTFLVSPCLRIHRLQIVSIKLTINNMCYHSGYTHSLLKGMCGSMAHPCMSYLWYKKSCPTVSLFIC